MAPNVSYGEGRLHFGPVVREESFNKMEHGRVVKVCLMMLALMMAPVALPSGMAPAAPAESGSGPGELARTGPESLRSLDERFRASKERSLVPEHLEALAQHAPGTDLMARAGAEEAKAYI